MTELDAQQHESEAFPPLTLNVDTPSSASPYPSPSSTFLPPPIPSAHEFANKIVHNKRYRALSTGAKEKKNPPGVKMEDGRRGSASAAAGTRSSGTVTPNSSLGLRLLDAANQSRQQDEVAQRQSPVVITTTAPPENEPKLLPNGSQPLVVGGSKPNPSSGSPPSRSPQITSPVSAVSPSTPTNASVTAKLFNANDTSAIQLRPNDKTPTGEANEQIELSRTPTSQAKNNKNEAPVEYQAKPIPSAHNRTFSNSSSTSQRYMSSGMKTPTAATSSPIQSKHASISSSRPAPPSPAMSRRNSTFRYSTSSQLSRSSSKSGGHGTPARRKSSQLSSSMVALGSGVQPFTEDKGKEKEAATKPKAEPKPIIVRDFAYPENDPRHSWCPPHLAWPPQPPPSHFVQQQQQTRFGWGYGFDSASASEFSEESDWGSTSGYYGGMVPLGQTTGKKKTSGWARVAAMLKKRNNPDAEDEDSLDGDNDDEEDEDEMEEEDSGQVYNPAHDGHHDADEEEEADGEPELVPGLYRALYAFEPEGTAEMALVEDQIVRVIARGGGVGWAIVLRDSTDPPSGPLALAGQALVPETYLEPVELDDGF